MANLAEFYRRAEALGHDLKSIDEEGSVTSREYIGSVHELRRRLGPVDAALRDQYDEAFRKKAVGREPSIDDLVNSFVFGNGKLTNEQHAVVAQHFPVVVTLQSTVDMVLPLGPTLYGPNSPPMVLNVGTLTIPPGAWMLTQTTNLALTASSVVVQSGTAPSGTPPYQIGIFGAPATSAPAGATGTDNTTAGQAGGGGDCIWGNGGCKDQPTGGGIGNPGGNGGPGANGQVGSPALTATIAVGTLTGALNVTSQGGQGQAGGTGGAGGKGSTGGAGGYGTSCEAASCNGGDGGQGGPGGNGGDGGNGGNGGVAQTVTITVTAPLQGAGSVFGTPLTSPVGVGGQGGAAGLGGAGGAGGGSGTGGSDGNQGAQGTKGSAGTNGANGQNAGPAGQILIKTS